MLETKIIEHSITIENAKIEKLKKLADAIFTS